MSRYLHDRNNLEKIDLVKSILAYHHNEYIQKWRSAFPTLPERWLKDQENCNNWLAKLKPSDCVEKAAGPAIYAFNSLLNIDVCSYEDIEAICQKIFTITVFNLDYKLWEFNELLIEIRKVEKYGYSKKLIESRPFLITACGLLSIFFPAILRCRIYLVRHNTENAFNIAYSDFFMESNDI